jgi:hypothetical protein
MHAGKRGQHVCLGRVEREGTGCVGWQLGWVECGGVVVRSFLKE